MGTIMMICGAVLIVLAVILALYYKAKPLRYQAPERGAAITKVLPKDLETARLPETAETEMLPNEETGDVTAVLPEEAGDVTAVLPEAGEGPTAVLPEEAETVVTEEAETVVTEEAEREASAALRREADATMLLPDEEETAVLSE